jgi:hypothetical protein
MRAAGGMECRDDGRSSDGLGSEMVEVVVVRQEPTLRRTAPDT